MSYTKTIVCLANSRKLAGRCVPGKEWDGRNLGAWCRPVSDRDRGELTAERWYSKTWRDPQLLDLVEVGLLGPRPSAFQTENHLVDTSVRWKYAGHVSARYLVPALDRPAGALWANGESTGCGLNDKVSAPMAARQKNSLVLVQPEFLTIAVNTEGADIGNPRRRVRGHFSLQGHDYILIVTDPIVEKQIMSNPDGFSRELQNPILCISLSEKYGAQNACYKLIAGVMRVSP
ncbi:MAG: hypothetical protein WCA49_24610 [Candidatus Sulfotelmatobacter sp.]